MSVTHHAAPPALAARGALPTASVVAVVGDRTVTLADVDARVDAIRTGPISDRLPREGTQEDVRLRRWVAQLLVAEALVAVEAAAAGLAGGDGGDGGQAAADVVNREALAAVTANGADALAAARTTAVATALFAHVTADVEVPAHEIRAYHDANLDLYARPEARWVRHLLVDDEAEAHRLRDVVAHGGDLAQLAARRSQDRGTRTRGGSMGWLRRGALVGAVEDAVFGAAIGAVVGPVRSDFGWHVLRVEAIRPAHHVPFAEARAAIAADLTASARGVAFDRWLERRRAERVALHPAFAHPGDPSLPDSVHRH